MPGRCYLSLLLDSACASTNRLRGRTGTSGHCDARACARRVCWSAARALDGGLVIAVVGVFCSRDCCAWAAVFRRCESSQPGLSRSPRDRIPPSVGELFPQPSAGMQSDDVVVRLTSERIADALGKPADVVDTTVRSELERLRAGPHPDVGADLRRAICREPSRELAHDCARARHGSPPTPGAPHGGGREAAWQRPCDPRW